MEEDVESWSYSFPPSTELLPVNSGSQLTPKQTSKSHINPSADMLLPADSEDSDSSMSANEISNSVSEFGAAPGAGISTESNGGDSSGFMKTPVATPVSSLPKSELTSLFGNAAGQLQPAFMLKAMPANPKTTKQDVNSVILKEGNTNALAINTSTLSGSRASTPLSSPTMKNDFKNSIKIWQQQTAEFGEAKADESLEQASEESSSLLRKTFTNFASSPIFMTLSYAQNEPISENGADGPSSPKIITYRKTNHQRTESENYDAALRQERFDPKLYIDEKFSNTIYRYATMKRNVDFHQLFRSLDLTDRLLDDFACALSREILLQGRIYITEHSVCFNLNLLGWVTSLVIPFDDVVRIDKKSTAGLFPNGIAIETNDAKHNFASFLSRDATYDFIRTIWLASTGKKLEELDQLAPDLASTIDEDQKLNNARKISNFILSIDDDEQNQLLWDKNGVDYEEEDESEDGDNDDSMETEEEDSGEDDLDSDSDAHSLSTEKKEARIISTGQDMELLTVGTLLRKLNPESRYKNLGPEVHAPTKVSQKFADSESEIEICKEIIEAPMGTVFDIMFGSNDTSFQRRFLEEHDASEIDEYDAFHPMEDEPTKLERTYTYRRALGYSIGPKSTKCEVSEVIEHLNFADYIVVLNTTATPDVPSGGSFTVKTRYYFTWGEANTTQLRIAYFVKWTGRSWIKNVVEKLTLSAQTAVTKDMIKEVIQEIDKNTTLVTGPAEVTQREPTEKKGASATKPPKKKKAAPKARKTSSQQKHTNFLLIGGIYFMVIVLLAIMYVQIRLVHSLGETKDLMSRQLLLTITLLNVFSSEKDDSWWKLKQPPEFSQNKQEQASYLARQALLFLVEEFGNDQMKEAAEKLL